MHSAMSNSSKPGFFSRLRGAISGTVNGAVESMRDPGAELALMLDDLAAQIKQAEKDLKQAMVDKKMMERKLEELKKEEGAWQTRAEQALKLGDEDLARAALERKQDKSQELKDTLVALKQQEGHVEEMAGHIKESKRKLKSLNLRRGSLMAQARAAKSGESADLGGAAVGKIDEIEDKIAELEAFNEVALETSSRKAADAELKAKLEQLDSKSELDDELAQLKAKMASKALTEGKDDDED
jgi:phage shock protein A